MENQLAVTNDEILKAATPEESRTAMSALYAFNKLIDREPRKEHIKVNQYSDKAKYLPIRVVENTLRAVFGVFEVEMIGQPQLMANSVVVSVHLRVYHPILQRWMQYAGTGAVPIELEKGATPTDTSKIKPKALHKNVPAALSFAVSNAAKKIGRIFGADLNTDELSETYNIYNL